VKLTYEDWLAIPYDGKRHEIMDGEYYVSSSPNLKHQLVVTELLTELGTHCQSHALGWVVSYVGTVLGEYTIAMPDLLFIGKDRASIISDYVQGAPDLIIEVLDTDRDYDERVKYQIYELAGVPEYWIIDPKSETAKVFRHAGGRFAAVEVGNVITTPLLPEFELRIADPFA